MVAEGFGLKAIQVKTPAELTEGLSVAFSSNDPVFLDVATEPEVDNLPPVFSWQKAAENE
jgi:acetolactate synthase I/II/III large subunit